MPLVISRPEPSARLETSPKIDRDIYDKLLPFDFLEFQNGTKIAQLKDIQTDELNILVKGCIKVKILCDLGETTLHEFHPGDVLRLADITRIATSEMGSPAHIRAVFHQEGDTRIVRLRQFEIERMFSFEARLKYRLIQEMMGRWHHALLTIQAQCREISNYIYGCPGTGRAGARLTNC